MTTYASEEHYLEDQIDSFAKAKKILKDYKKKLILIYMKISEEIKKKYLKVLIKV